jgi:hypothetical protein
MNPSNPPSWKPTPPRRFRHAGLVRFACLASAAGVGLESAAAGVGLETSGSGAVPSVGKAAPAFSMRDDSGAAVTLESLRGSRVVLAFYPKDFTPG